VACGTSWHAALAGKFMIERLARMPGGGRLRLGVPLPRPDPRRGNAHRADSQSGETADTLAAQREAKQKGSPTLAICNVMGSMLTREASGTLLTHAGPEIGVASTKAFTAQLTALFVLALYLASCAGGWMREESLAHAQELLRVPALLETCCRTTRPTTKWPARSSRPPISSTWAAASTTPSPSKAR
jgi:glutamine---fructose-6-phosphate transaminase (isomerizing)